MFWKGRGKKSSVQIRRNINGIKITIKNVISSLRSNLNFLFRIELNKIKTFS